MKEPSERFERLKIQIERSITMKTKLTLAKWAALLALLSTLNLQL